MLRGAAQALLVLWLVAGLTTPVAADSAVPTVWDKPRVVDTDVVVAAGEILVVRGARIEFAGGSLTVEKGGRLVVESTDTDAAALVAGEGKTWNATIKGAAELRGTPQKKVAITGTGERAFSEAVIVLGGFRIEGGTLDAQHTLFGVYGSGLALYEGAVANLSHVVFASADGRAIVNSASTIHVRDSSFVGAGSGVFVTVSDGARFSNVSFDGIDTALTVRASRLDLTDASFTRVATCMAAMGDAQLNVTGVTCEDFRTSGLDAAAIPSGRGAGSPRIDISDGAFSTDRNETLGMEIGGATELSLTNVVVGPVGGDGIVVKDTAYPSLTEVDFSQIDGYALVVVQPETLPDLAIPSGAVPGQGGWMRVMNRSLVQVEDSEGHQIAHARVKILDASGAAILDAEANDNGMTDRFLVETVAVDGNGTAKRATYAVVIEDVPGFQRYEGPLPTHGVALIAQLKPTTEASGQGTASTPGFAPLALFLVLALVALRSRR